MMTWGKAVNSARQAWGRFISNGLFRTTGALTISNAFTQLIGVVAIFVLDRVTTQENIGVYAQFIALGTIIGPLGLMSLHLAIPGLHLERVKAMTVTLLLTGSVTALLAWVGATAFDYRFSLQLGALLLVTNWVQLAEQLSIHSASLRGMVISRFASRTTFVLLLIVVPAGLNHELSGEAIINLQVATTGVIGLVYVVATLTGKLHCSVAMLRAAVTELKSHLDFPVYIAPSQVFNTLAYHLPVVLIAQYFQPAAAAQYSVTLRFCFAPIQLVANSLGQALHFEFARLFPENPQSLARQFDQVWRSTLAFSLLTFAVLVFVAPIVVIELMGTEWQLAASMIRTLSPMYALMLMTSSLSAIFVVLGRRRYVLLNQLIYLFISAGSFGYAILTNQIFSGVMLFSVLSCFRYLVLLREMRIIVRTIEAT